MSIIESQKAISEAETVSKLTALAFFFVPLSFIASVFGMNLVVGPLLSYLSSHPSTELIIPGIRPKTQNMDVGHGLSKRNNYHVQPLIPRHHHNHRQKNPAVLSQSESAQNERWSTSLESDPIF